jgi:hypothetical protein
MSCPNSICSLAAAPSAHGPEPPSARGVADAEKIAAIWNARPAGGRALWFYPTIGAAIAAGVPSSPTLARRAGNTIDRPAHARPAPGRMGLNKRAAARSSQAPVLHEPHIGRNPSQDFALVEEIRPGGI